MLGLLGSSVRVVAVAAAVAALLTAALGHPLLAWAACLAVGVAAGHRILDLAFGAGEEESRD